MFSNKFFRMYFNVVESSGVICDDGEFKTVSAKKSKLPNSSLKSSAIKVTALKIKIACLQVVNH